MKFFTRGWALGEFDDEDSDRIRADYWRHYEAIAPRLPEALRRLHRANLHDAAIEQVLWHPERKRLKIAYIVCPDDPRPPAAVLATYSGALLGDRRVESLRRAARDRETTVLYDEVDIDREGRLVHRLLFDPREEVEIDFSTLELAIEPRSDRRVRLAPAFLEQVDEVERT